MSDRMIKEGTLFARRVGAKLVVVVGADNTMTLIANFVEPLGPDAVRAAAMLREQLLPVTARYTAPKDDQ